MSNRVTTAVILTVALFLTTGCVYYNTFYHARAAAREAELLRERRAPDEPLTPRESELLDRVVEKSSRVLQLHPDSGWADDALLLLGTTHYHQGRYESAEQRLTEFLSLYPDSELRPRAEYMLARVLIARGNPVSAETMLEPLARAQPPDHLSDDALALIGQARYSRKKYGEAAEAYAEVLSRFPRSDIRAQVRFLAAENFEMMGDLESAANQFELVLDEKGSRALAFEARMRLVNVDLLSGRSDEALQVLDEMERRTEDRDELDRVLLLKGRALEDLGRFEDAIATYEGVTATHKRSDASGEAQYRIGTIYRDHHEMYEEASNAFRKSKEEASRSETAVLATEAISDITKLTGHLATIREYEAELRGAAGDSAATLDGSASRPADAAGGGVSVPVGTTVTADMEHTSALPGPGDAPSGAAADTAAGAATAVDIRDTLGDIADTAGAAVAYPTGADTTGAVGAAGDTLQSAAAGAVPDSAALTAEEAAAAEAAERRGRVAVARLRAAELYLFRFDDPVRARAHYESVLELHPESPQAPKAGLALAWLLENKLGDLDAAAAAYEDVERLHPDTDYSRAARTALDRITALRGEREE